jgi:hypothetical protein
MRRILVLAMFCAAAARGQDLRVDFVRDSLTGPHVHYRQYIGGVPVIGGERIETPSGTRETLARRGFSHVESAVASAHRGDVVYLNVDGVARLAIREVTGGVKPVATFIDAATGETLAVQRLYYEVAARVFAVNPVVKLNDPALSDSNNAASAVPDAAYSMVDLADLGASGPLTGPYARVVDTDAPFTSRAEISKSLLFDRSQPQFEEVNAYFHVDRSQRYLRSLGFPIGYAIPIDVHSVGGADNSFFASGNVRGEGQLFFGDGGTDDAEDSDIVLHEFMHAVHTWIAPDAFNGSSASEGRALAEGLGDYWAFSQNYDETARTGRDPFCIGDWDARCFGDDSDQKCGYPSGADCLRRVDSHKTMADFLRVDAGGFEHRNGEIWSSVLREIFMAAGARTTDALVIESLYGAPANTTFTGQAKRMLDADATLNGGANYDVICHAMMQRQILAVGDCAVPRGEWTLQQSVTSTIHVDDARAIAGIEVRVQTRASARVTLTAPDGTAILLATALNGEATFGLDALPVQPLDILVGRSAKGDWKLTVDGAALVSWSLIVRFAGDVPFATRPASSTQVSKHIPVVAHVTGAAATPFSSDVRILNKSDLPASLIAIFTPSGVDGTKTFAAMRLSVEPQHLLVLNDVVRTVLQTTGIGQLQIIGDTDRIVVTSRASGTFRGASLGDSIPALDTSEAGGTEIAPLVNTIDARSNVGVAEVLGGSGVIRFTYLAPNGSEVGSSEVSVAPFGHVQIRVPVVGLDLHAHVSIVSGNPRVIAYGTVISNQYYDSFTTLAQKLPQVPGEIAIPRDAGNPLDYLLKTDVWELTPSRQLRMTPGIMTGTSDVLFINNTSGSVFVARSHAVDPVGIGMFVPAVSPPQGAPQHLIYAVTEVGLVNFEATAVDATILVYDAAGVELSRTVVQLPPRSMKLTLLRPVTPQRVEVRGPVAAFSVIRESADYSYFVGQY